MLAAVAHRLRHAVRRGDPLARWGGDEFALVLPSDAGGLRAGGVAERMLRAIRSPLPMDGGALVMHASAGIAVRRLGEDVRGLTRRADRALYAAKSDGGDRWCLEGWIG